MKSKVLITIIIWFILNILLVNSQEAKCPPDCSSPSKITETSYLDSNSYNDKKFYENSDPKKWNFRDPNFDYSKIPLAKYKELPYTNPDVDHSRLDPNKYISAFGCSTCTFRIATTQKIQYSTDGVLHTKTGLARIPSNYPPNTLFIATNEGIFIGLPKIDEKSKLDISNVGSATLITNNQKVTLSNGLTIDGRLSFKDNQAFVSKNDELVLDGIKIKPKGNDVFVYSDGKPHQGNYVSYGEKKLIAEGNNFDLEFTSENKYVKVFGDSSILKGTKYSTIYKSPELLQDDYLYISLGGNEDKYGNKYGKVTLTNRDDKNLLPLIEERGLVRLWNDRNDLTIDENLGKLSDFWTVTQKFYTMAPSIREGSVSMQMVVGEDAKKIYTFTENREVILIENEQAKNMDELRQNILEKYHVVLTGFFDESHLQGFTSNLEKIEKLGVDFSRYKEIKGKDLNILETDLKAYPYSVTPSIKLTSEGPVVSYPEASITGGEYINWLVRARRTNSYRIESRYWEYVPDRELTTLTHEIGHKLSLENPELKKSFIQKGTELGMQLREQGININLGGNVLFKNRGPADLFPSPHSESNIEEFQAELFEKMVNDPKWFNTPERQAFRGIWLKELEKYKKPI